MTKLVRLLPPVTEFVLEQDRYVTKYSYIMFEYDEQGPARPIGQHQVGLPGHDRVQLPSAEHVARALRALADHIDSHSTAQPNDATFSTPDALPPPQLLLTKD